MPETPSDPAMTSASPGRIVIWGLRKKYHTHRHIHKAFYESARKLGYDAVWLEDEPESRDKIKAGDLIIASEVQGRMVPPKEKFEDYILPVRSDVKYCLHNLKPVFSEKLDKTQYIELNVYKKSVETSADFKIDTARYYDSRTRTLYQPWGTDLLPQEFKKPVFNRTKFVFWIGSIWNNASGQGNVPVIARYKEFLATLGLKFIGIRFVPDWVNVFLIRHSRIAPALTGEYQQEVQYLPCRMFKNISYGQLGFSNIEKFNDILDDAGICSTDTEAMTKRVLALSKEEYLDLVARQQAAISTYTYKDSLENIIRLLYPDSRKA